MRYRNEALHAEINRMIDLEAQMSSCKAIAARHHTTAQTVRVLMSRARKLRKLTIVKIHVEPEMR